MLGLMKKIDRLARNTLEMIAAKSGGKTEWEMCSLS